MVTSKLNWTDILVLRKQKPQYFVFLFCLSKVFVFNLHFQQIVQFIVVKKLILIRWVCVTYLIIQHLSLCLHETTETTWNFYRRPIMKFCIKTVEYIKAEGSGFDNNNFYLKKLFSSFNIATLTCMYKRKTKKYKYVFARTHCFQFHFYLTGCKCMFVFDFLIWHWNHHWWL